MQGRHSNIGFLIFALRRDGACRDYCNSSQPRPCVGAISYDLTNEFAYLAPDRNQCLGKNRTIRTIALRSPTSDSGRFGFTLKPETAAVDLFQ